MAAVRQVFALFGVVVEGADERLLVDQAARVVRDRGLISALDRDAQLRPALVHDNLDDRFRFHDRYPVLETPGAAASRAIVSQSSANVHNHDGNGPETSRQTITGEEDAGRAGITGDAAVTPDHPITHPFTAAELPRTTALTCTGHAARWRRDRPSALPASTPPRPSLPRSSHRRKARPFPVPAPPTFGAPLTAGRPLVAPLEAVASPSPGIRLVAGATSGAPVPPVAPFRLLSRSPRRARPRREGPRRSVTPIGGAVITGAVAPASPAPLRPRNPRFTPSTPSATEHRHPHHRRGRHARSRSHQRPSMRRRDRRRRPRVGHHGRLQLSSSSRSRASSRTAQSPDGAPSAWTIVTMRARVASSSKRGERGQERLHARIAVVRLLRVRRLQHPRESGRHVGAVQAERVGRVGAHLGREGERGVGHVRLRAGEELVHADAENVGARVDVLGGAHLLRGHVRGRPIIAVVYVMWASPSAANLEMPKSRTLIMGEPSVRFVRKKFAGLTSRWRRCRCGAPTRARCRPARRTRSPPRPACSGGPRGSSVGPWLTEVLHDHVRKAVRHAADVDHLGHVLARDAGGGARFAHEALGHVGDVRDRGGGEFDRDLLAQLDVLGAHDHAHAADADRARREVFREQERAGGAVLDVHEGPPAS